MLLRALAIFSLPAPMSMSRYFSRRQPRLPSSESKLLDAGPFYNAAPQQRALNELTLGKEHLVNLLGLVEKTNFRYILESNGTLIGHDQEYARELSKFKCVHVRISLKGTDAQEFSKLTGADPKAFDLQLKALENLASYGVSCNPAVMLSFSSPKGFERLKGKLASIGQSFVDCLEEEYVILYPPVVKRLKESGITPSYVQPRTRMLKRT